MDGKGYRGWLVSIMADTRPMSRGAGAFGWVALIIGVVTIGLSAISMVARATAGLGIVFFWNNRAV